MTDKEICEEIVENRDCGYAESVECKDCPLNNGDEYDCSDYKTSVDAALSWLGNFREEDESEKLKKENAELRAQLARCVQALETYRKSFEDGFASSILDSLPKQAKADAEVLRCAEEETKMHNVGVDASGEISEVECDCKLCNAVRAAKEAR